MPLRCSSFILLFSLNSGSYQAVTLVILSDVVFIVVNQPRHLLTDSQLHEGILFSHQVCHSPKTRHLYNLFIGYVLEPHRTEHHPYPTVTYRQLRPLLRGLRPTSEKGKHISLTASALLLSGNTSSMLPTIQPLSPTVNSYLQLYSLITVSLQLCHKS